MERVLLALGLWFSVPAHADVVLAEPTTLRSADESRYPESRFGAQPADPVFGVIRPSDEDDEDTPMRRRGRSPASEAGALGQSLSRPNVMTGESEDTGAVASQGRPAAIIPEKAKGVQEVALIAGDLGYFPRTVFVTRDIPVRLYVTGASKSTLCIMMDMFHVRKQVRSNEIQEVEFTPREPGKYRFYCPVNGMEGSLVVRDVAIR